MSGGLQPDGRGPGSRISPTGWHRADLVEDEIVVFTGCDLGEERGSNPEAENKSQDDRERLCQSSSEINRTRAPIRNPRSGDFLIADQQNRRFGNRRSLKLIWLCGHFVVTNRHAAFQQDERRGERFRPDR